jgi:hypothetical protein
MSLLHVSTSIYKGIQIQQILRMYVYIVKIQYCQLQLLKIYKMYINQQIFYNST